MGTNCAKWLEAVCATLIKSAGAMTAPRAREQNRPPSPPDRLPPRRGGRPSSRTCSAAGRPAGLARLGGAAPPPPRPCAGRRGAARALRRPRPPGDGRGADRHHPGQQHRSECRRCGEALKEDCTSIHHRFERGRVYPDRRRHRLCQQQQFHGDGVRDVKPPTRIPHRPARISILLAALRQER